MVWSNCIRTARMGAHATVWACLLWFAAPASAASIDLAWDPSPETNIVRYRVYIGRASNTYTEVHDVSAPRTTFSFLTPLPGVRYYFAVSAVTSANVESVRSNEVTGIWGADASPPTVVITSPGAALTIAVPTIALKGMASDNIGVTHVTWANDRGGSGSATGTASWAISSVPLQAGLNVITVTARDAASNTARASVAVTYEVADTIRPTIAITSPAAATTVDTTTIGVVGTARDNVGVTRVTWTTSSGASGTAIGTHAWAVADIPLRSGSNVVTVTAHDAAGNTNATSVAVTYRAPRPTGTAVLDTFTGGNGTLLTAHPADVRPPNTHWVVFDRERMSLESGRLRRASAGPIAIAVHESGTADGSVAVDFASSSARPYAGLVFRALDSQRMLVLGYATSDRRGVLGLFRGNGRQLVPLYQMVVPAAGNPVIRLEARLAGSRVQAVLDGKVVFERAVTDYQSATKHGVLSYAADANVRYDNFEVKHPAAESLAAVAGGAAPGGGGATAATAIAPSTSEVAGEAQTSDAIVLDTFTDSDGTQLVVHSADAKPLGTAWTQLEGSSSSLMTGRATPGTGSAYAIAVHESGVSNGSVAVELASGSSAPHGGLVLRALDARRMLVLRYTSWNGRGYLGLFRRVDRDFVLVKQVTVPAAAGGAVLRLEARMAGSRVEAVLNGEVRFVATVTDYQSATKHGLLWHAPTDPAARFDNFRVKR